MIFIFVSLGVSVLKRENAWMLLNRFWYVPTIYAGIVFFALYVYQFEYLNDSIRAFVESIPPQYRLYMEEADIGFSKYDNKAVGLLPYSIIFILCVLQLRSFRLRLAEYYRHKAAKV